MLPSPPTDVSVGQPRRSNDCRAAERAMKTERNRTGSSSTCSGGSMERVAGEVEVGALGLLMYQAAREGSAVGLRFALSRRGGGPTLTSFC